MINTHFRTVSAVNAQTYLNCYVIQFKDKSNNDKPEAWMAKQLIETGVLKHDDEKCFWTDTHYSSKEEMEIIYGKHGLEIIDHFAQDGLAPLLSHKVDNWNESQFKTWCDYHYSICREQSILGSSNHVIIIGRNDMRVTLKNQLTEYIELLYDIYIVEKQPKL